MATIKFWSEMTKATSVDGQDKVMIGKNSNGEAMYVDFQYLINQAGMNSSDYIPIDGNTLPTLGTENKFSIVGSGTYTQSGGSDIVVDDNTLAVLSWDGSVWTLGSSVEMPEQSADGEIVEGDDRAISGDTAYNRLMSKDEFLTPKGKNLYDKSENEGGVIGSDGTWLYSEFQDTSGFIPVEKDVTYTMSGGFNATSAKRILLFGSRDNQDIIDFFIGVDTFTPSIDGFIKTNANTTTADVSDTLQIEVGTTATDYEPYNPNKKIKDKYIHIPVGEIKESDDGFVQGGEVFDKTLVKDVYLYNERTSVNLFDKEAVREGKALNGTGGIYTPSNSFLAISDYIPVTSLSNYVVSGWFPATGMLYAFFENIGDTESIGGTRYEYTYGDIITPPNENCYLVVNVTRVAGSGDQDARDTLQIEEGVTPTAYEPYSDETQEKIKPEFLPKTEDLKPIKKLYNLFSVENIRHGKLNKDGSFDDNSDGDLSTGLIELPNVTFLYISGLGTGNFERVYKQYDENKNLISFAYNNFYGSRHRVLLNANAKYISVFFKDKEEDVNLDNIYFSPYRDKLADGSQIIDVRDNRTYHLSRFKDSNTYNNSNLNTSFTINSAEVVKNALIPVFLHKGSRPSGASIYERHIYLGEDVQNDFSDIGVLKDGVLKPIKVHAGNYSLVPYNTLKYRMFQDPDDGYILGSNYYEGIFKSEDDGLTWDLLKGGGAKLVFMTSIGDLIFQVGQSLLYTTKTSNYSDDKVIYTSPYSSFTAGASQFTESDDGDIYFGTYQTEFNAQIYKSEDGGSSFSLVYDNSRKQHIHKIWTHNGVIFANIDGGTIQNPNDENPQNSSMAVYKSEDGGDTWEMVKYNWSTDYGVNNFYKGYYYGSAEANIKYSPSLYRSRDLVNWEIIFDIPVNSQSMRVFDDHFIQNTVAYGSFNRAQTLLSNDGVSFTPIFDTKPLDSSQMSNALRVGIQEVPENHFVDINGDKWIPMASAGEVPSHKLYIGGDRYQALVYIQTDLDEGVNEFNIVNHHTRISPSKKRDFYPLLKVIPRENEFEFPNGDLVQYPEGSIISDGTFDGHTYPYTLNKEPSVRLAKPLSYDTEVSGVKSVRFGYKSYRWNGSNTTSILKIGDFELLKRGQTFVFKEGGSEFEVPSALRVYFGKPCLDVVLTIDGVNLKFYLNGFLVNSLPCNISEINGRGITIQDEDSMDFISKVEMFDRVLFHSEIKEMFEGFNIF